MGNCASSSSADEAPSTPEKQRSLAIDRQIAEDERNFKKECKILLLGSGESGKSTIVKQMKIIHLHGYTQDELKMYRAVVNRNVVESAQSLVLAMRKFGMDCVHSSNRVSFKPTPQCCGPCPTRVLLLSSFIVLWSNHPSNRVFSSCLSFIHQ